MIVKLWCLLFHRHWHRQAAAVVIVPTNVVGLWTYCAKCGERFRAS